MLPRSLSRRCSAALLCAGLLASAQAQSFTLRADVLGGGATAAASADGDYTLRGTVGQAAAGPAASDAYALGSGFWYPAASSAPEPPPALVVALVPLNPPVTVPAGGGTFQFQVSVTNTTGAPQSFQGWTDATLPNGQPFGPALGPQALTVAPGGTFGPVTLAQQVPGTAPPGAYSYTAYAGTFPGGAVGTDSFPFTKASAPSAPTLSERAVSEAPARTQAAASGTAGSSATASTALVSGTAAPGAAIPEAAAWPVLAAATGAAVLPPTGLAEAARAEDALADADEATDAALAAEDAASEVLRTGGAAGAAALPQAVSLSAPFPNPFAAQATVRFALPEAAEVRCVVYDALGRRVATLAEGWRDAGYHEAVFDGCGLPAGLYLLRFESTPPRAGAARSVHTQRATLLR
ncbi:MAG: hypothetical protein AAGI91_05710 [Bacteroidota bacterium]